MSRETSNSPKTQTSKMYLCNSFCFDLADMQPDNECLLACKNIYDPTYKSKKRIDSSEVIDWKKVILKSIENNKEKIDKRYEDNGKFLEIE